MSELKLPECWQSLGRAGHSRKAWTATYEPLRGRQLTGTDVVWVRRNCIAPLAYHNLRQRLTSNSLLYPLDAASLHNSALIPH